MNTPTNNSPFVQTTRKRVQAQVVTLERVQQSFPATSFSVSQVVHQQRPRFGNDASLARLDIKEVEVEGMRGVLESCWDLSATTTTTAPPVHQVSSTRHAQMQRLRRTRSEPHGRLYSLGTAPGLQPSAPKSRSSATSSASASALLSPVLQSAAGVTDQQTHQLRVLMDLWHLFATHESFHTSQDFGGHGVFMPRAPRLLTAEEERVLGSIVQQHRKLQQVMAQQHQQPPAAPDADCSSSSSSGVALSPPAGPSSSSSGSTEDTSSSIQPKKGRGRPPSRPRPSSSTSSSKSKSSSSSSSSSKATSSSSGGKVKVDKRVKWPPLLTDADITEVSQMSPAWRALLPMLAEQAQQLLVAFNTGLVLFMLARTWHTQAVPVSDLVFNGLAGLRLAAARFDPSKGTRFSTVASAWVGQHIARSSVAESGRAIQRPEHHARMVRFVSQRHGLEGVENIHNRPDIVAEVAQHFNTTPPSVIEAIRDTYAVGVANSLEALAVDTQSSKGANGNMAWAGLLSTADLDEEEGQLGRIVSGGLGTLMASAGHMPAWAQAGMRERQQQQLQGDAQGSASTSSSSSSGQQGSEQQQEEDEGGNGSRPQQQTAAASLQQIQDAAVELSRMASGSGVSWAAAGSTEGMLGSMEDPEGVLQQHMQQLLHVLSPIEQRVISLMYDLDSDRAAGLGVELPPLAYGSISSSDAACSSGKQGRGAVQLADTQGRNAKVLSSARFQRHSTTLKAAAELLQLPNHQMVANIRNMALGKLAAAARSHSCDQAAQEPAEANAADEAEDEAGDSSSSRGSGRSRQQQAYVQGSTMQLIQLLQEYVEEHGCLPVSMHERYKGKLLANWVARIRARYRAGKVAPVVAATLEQAVPIWDWQQPSRQRGRPSKRGKLSELPVLAGAAADAPAAGVVADAAAAGGGVRHSVSVSATKQQQQQQEEVELTAGPSEPAAAAAAAARGQSATSRYRRVRPSRTVASSAASSSSRYSHSSSSSSSSSTES